MQKTKPIEARTKLPCLECNDECEAKKWIYMAKIFSEGGAPVAKINLPCPKNKMTYVVSLDESK